MKKHLLILCMVASLMACSKNDDEPSGGGSQNQGTETPGGSNGGGTTESLNDQTYNWIGVLAEYTLVKDGQAPVFNTSKACLEWKEKYEKYFTFMDVGALWNYTWSNSFDYTFSELDSFASEYVGFTMGEYQSTEGYDYYTATFQNYWDIDPSNYSYKGYFLYYTYDESLIQENIEDNWVAYFSTYNYNTDAVLSKEYLEWENSHKGYLTSEEQIGSGYKKIWTFNLKYLDNEYIIEEIYPFIYFMNGNSILNEVNVHKNKDGVNRRFVNIGGSLLE